ncbi:4-amino-4-deoxychorismate lyase [Amylibacter marinus]|uniref:Endolytic murein transglycosylase n=1 Tax=Amylibacter marinus TaxID=1475483 RepID=A0ABQ5VRY6_9RHOB|nr:endolytic transglycosylase MltG [Amylibacter marinus]GLQ34046.1 4-amino-4-deoxychorismate lyase [Amylibacter marinus]
MFARHIAANFINLLILSIFAMGGVSLWAKGQLSAEGPLDEDTRFEVKAGDRFTPVANRLEKAGIISNAMLFRISARYSKQDQNLKFGKYAVPAGATMGDVLALITSGRSVGDLVTFPEGFSSYQVVDRLMGVEALTGEITTRPPEGYLAPNSYGYTDGDDRQAILDKMLAAQIVILDEAWANRAPDLPLKSKEEALILASIIEKETGVSSEREEVAAVFINRLRRGMKLQTDPTVIYGITKGEKSLGRGIRRSELLKKTDYNTYIIPALPPTPIANPGAESIRAALNPAESENLFFVADGTGGHAFAKTLAEHNANVAKWRKIERERKANAAEGKQ